MLSLEQFGAVIGAVRAQDAAGDRFAAAMEEFLDGRFVSNLATEVVAQLVTVTALHFSCDAEDFLNWWLWERPGGEEPSMWDVDGSVIRLTTIEDVYAYLCTLAAPAGSMKPPAGKQKQAKEQNAKGQNPSKRAKTG